MATERRLFQACRLGRKKSWAISCDGRLLLFLLVSSPLLSLARKSHNKDEQNGEEGKFLLPPDHFFSSFGLHFTQERKSRDLTSLHVQRQTRIKRRRRRRFEGIEQKLVKFFCWSAHMCCIHAFSGFVLCCHCSVCTTRRKAFIFTAVTTVLHPARSYAYRVKSVSSSLAWAATASPSVCQSRTHSRRQAQKRRVSRERGEMRHFIRTQRVISPKLEAKDWPTFGSPGLHN